MPLGRRDVGQGLVGHRQVPELAGVEDVGRACAPESSQKKAPADSTRWLGRKNG